MSYQATSGNRDMVDKMTDGILKAGNKFVDKVLSMNIWQWVIFVSFILTMVLWLLTSTRILILVIISDALFFAIGYKGIPALKKKKRDEEVVVFTPVKRKADKLGRLQTYDSAEERRN